ncbi:alpha/beta fold hydrolase [Sphingobium sufflavum]|uniref:alpha/beta fold hydrolase n=1 Tax=Sphingobium sufflavum TaxID=1129547 RepID=UPI001F452D4F|nr:alpha/beta fold hydrolase [Sphingobium sufflavum]
MLWRETEGDADFRTRAFAGLRRFQGAARPQHERPVAIAASVGRVRLLHYEPLSAADAQKPPVLFVPSLINAPDVLDMSPDNSLLRFLCAQGHDVYQVDWGNPAEGDRDQDIGRYVTDLLLPLIAALPRPPIMVGYCLGGTIAIAAAALAPCAALATIAAPWCFDAYPQGFRDQTHQAWALAEPACRQLGVMPMEVLQAGFWSLDPRRTIEKYAIFADMAQDDPGHDSFLLLEDWVNEGAPLTYAAGHELIERFYAADIPGSGQWIVGGQTIDPAALPCPTLAISSTRDRIVPHDARPPATERISLDLGHVGMVVGRSARQKLWEPLSAWLSAQGG